MSATLIQPVLFSIRFGIPSNALATADLIDPILATAQQIIRLGEKNQNIIPLMGLWAGHSYGLER